MRLVKTLLDSFNPASVGLMTGKGRHPKLQYEIQMAANGELAPGGTLRDFYSVLAEAMQWRGEPLRVTRAIAPLIRAAKTEEEKVEERDVLRLLAHRSSVMYGLARIWHDDERKERKKEFEELEAEWRDVEAAIEKSKEAENGLF